MHGHGRFCASLNRTRPIITLQVTCGSEKWAVGRQAHGHTNPTLPIMKELVTRGHEVIYYSNAALRDKVAPTGADHLRFGDHVGLGTIHCDRCSQKAAVPRLPLSMLFAGRIFGYRPGQLYAKDRPTCFGDGPNITVVFAGDDVVANAQP
jgi:hypothetical protein